MTHLPSLSRLPGLNPALLIKGNAVAERTRSQLHSEMQDARALGRSSFITDRLYGNSFLVTLHISPYAHDSLLAGIYREAVMLEGRDLYDLMLAQERGRK